MRLAILSFGAGWHVRELMRAAKVQGHTVDVVDFRRVWAGVSPGADAPAAPGAGSPSSLSGYGAVIVRTMPPGSLEQVVFRMDVLHRFQAEGKKVLNSPLA